MAKRYEMSEEQIREIEAARKKTKNKSIDKRLKALQLYAEGRTSTEIAERTGYAKTYIYELVSRYRKSGICGMIENHYSGNRRNLSFEEEEALLESFKKSAAAGQIIEVGEIKAAYEKAINRSLDNSRGQIYRVMKRHGWRKIMPRSKHPNKASDEVIEASKKLTQSSEKKWEISQKKGSD